MLANTLAGHFGFTTVELMVTLAFFTLIFALSSVNISGLIPSENLDQTTAALVSDLRMQQLKAMLGDKELTTTTSPFGVYFETDKYILFKGSTYTPTAAAVTVKLPSNITFETVPFAQQTLVFRPLNGEVTLPSATEAQFRLVSSQTNETKVITVNSLGVVYVE